MADADEMGGEGGGSVGLVAGIPAGVGGDGRADVGQADAGELVAVGVDRRDVGRIFSTLAGGVAADALGCVGAEVDGADSGESLGVERDRPAR